VAESVAGITTKGNKNYEKTIGRFSDRYDNFYGLSDGSGS